MMMMMAYQPIDDNDDEPDDDDDSNAEDYVHDTDGNSDVRNYNYANYDDEDGDDKYKNVNCN